MLMTTSGGPQQARPTAGPDEGGAASRPPGQPTHGGPVRVVGGLPPTVLGSRLRLARRARGMSQEVAASKIGISRPTLIATEQGRRRPSPDELVALARLYGQDVADLVRTTDPVDALASGLYVPDGGEGAAMRAAIADFQQVADEVCLFEARVGLGMPRRYPAPYELDGIPGWAAAEQVAAAERRRLGLGDGPVRDLRAVLENEYGIKVFVLGLPAELCGIYALVEPAGACVVVGAAQPGERQRWAMAHELAHFLTDRWAAEITALVPPHRPRELFAEGFATHFLMPSSGLVRRFQGVSRGRGHDLTATDLLDLASDFGVSAQGCAARLENLGLVTRGLWDRLLGSGQLRPSAGRDGRLAQDRELLPRRIRLLAAEAYLRGSLSDEAFARLLRVDRADVPHLARRVVVTEEIDDGALRQWAMEMPVPDLAEAAGF